MASVTNPANAPRGGRGGPRLGRPGRDEVVDAVALVVLTMIGIVGFRPAYGGHGYLAAGAAGVVLGLLLSHAGQRARVPLLAVVAVSVLAFLLFGGVISQTGTVSLPVLRTVANAAVSGWTAAADHRPAGRPHRRAARAALPARPVQRRGRARARPPHQRRAAARRRARRGGRAVHPVRRGAADRRRAPGRRVRRPRARLGRRAPAARRRAADHARQAASLAADRRGGRRARRGRRRRHGHRPAPARRERPSARRALRRAAVRRQRLPEPARRVPRLHQGRAGRRQRLRQGTARHHRAARGQPGAHRGDGHLRRPGLGRRQRRGGQLVVRRLPAGRHAAAGGVRRPDPHGDDHHRARLRPAVAARPGRHHRVLLHRGGRPQAAAALRFNVATTTGIIPDGVPAGLRYTVSAAAVAAPAAAGLAAASPEGTPDPPS